METSNDDDRTTFRRVYDDQFRFVWRSLRRLGVREDDVADVTQDVFVIVHRKLADFEGKSKITTWLFAICMRVARDRRQSAVVRKEIATSDADLGERQDPGPGVDEQVDHRQRRELLERLLDELSDEQRVVFTLFELEGLDGDAIAELLDVPVGTVRSRLRLARDGFRRALVRHEAKARRLDAVGVT